MSDVQSVSAPNANKTIGSVGGGAAGAALGTGLIALLSVKYPALSPTASAAIGGALALILGTIGTFLAPILTAAQRRAIHALDDGASDDQKTIMTVAKAQDIVAAASTSIVKP